MSKVKIITDSCCSFSKEKLESMGIDYLSMDITVNNKTCNSFTPDIKDPKEFYEILEKSEQCSTSCINHFEFNEMFEKYLKEGYDIFYIGLSGGMSSTYQNAKSVANELNEKYENKVYVANSLTGSYGIALMLESAKKLADDGKSAEEIFQAVDHNGLNIFSIFAPGDLKFLKRSGRINKFVASIGTMFKIVPIISADSKGELKLISKSIGRKKAISLIENYAMERLDLTRPEKIYIGHTGQIEEAEQIAKYLKENTENKEIVIDYIDYTMGCNCGPKTISLFGYTK